MTTTLMHMMLLIHTYLYACLFYQFQQEVILVRQTRIARQPFPSEWYGTPLLRKGQHKKVTPVVSLFHSFDNMPTTHEIDWHR